MQNMHQLRWITPLLAVLLLFSAAQVRADAVTEWNARACDVVFAAQLSPPAANRAMAIVQTAVYEAVTVAGRDGTSAEAAVAAANRAALSKLAPTQQAAIDRGYQTALSAIPDGTAKTQGIALGEQAAVAALALRAADETIAPDSWRPPTTPGAYVPTALPVGRYLSQRKPWLMSAADQFRPGPPPALSSALWARDYNEIKALGARNSTRRSAGQTQVARFWEATEPAIYAPVIRSVAEMPGRDIARNARLYAIAYQAVDDALIAVFDAKYHYSFWRPVTAIRNGDLDGNDATGRDASWMPFIDTPMHPEYPCAHCIVASTIGTILKAELGTEPTPVLSSSSSKAPGVVRRWNRIDDFVQEVAEARICDGVHYRNSTEVGIAMGAKIGTLAVARHAPARE